MSRWVVSSATLPLAARNWTGRVAVAGHGQDEEQLFQVGPVVLVVSPGDRGGGLAAPGRLLSGLLVGTVEGHRGRVVVQLVEFDGELAHGVGDDREGERGDVAVEEPIEATAHAIVVEVDQLVGGEAQPPWDEPRGPFADAVERLAGDQQVLDQQEQSGGGGDLGAGILARQAIAEELREPEPPEDRVEDRQGAEAVGVEGASVGLGDLAGSGLGCGSVGPPWAFLGHRVRPLRSWCRSRIRPRARAKSSRNRSS